MKQDNPLTQAAVIAAVVIVFLLWLADLRKQRAGTPNPRAFPGAQPVATRAVLIAVMGAVVLLALETLGEIQLGLVAEQSTMTLLGAAYSLAMAFLEELVFRGYLVVRNRGRSALVISILGFSMLFALIHPFLWTWSETLPTFTPSLKGWFSTAIVYLGSLWFYYVRFQAPNPQHSLIPCIAAHAAKNLGVVIIKGAQGFLVLGF